MELPELRTDYERGRLTEDDARADPFDQLRSWIEEAAAANVAEPHALGLSTVGADGRPSSRNLLLRGLDTGLVVYTNTRSRKGRELADSPWACALFSWLGMQRQVRVEGRMAPVSAAEADTYFATRPRGSQIGAWASEQSEPVASRAVLEAAWGEASRRFDGLDVPRPPHWGGYRLTPDAFEFWQGRLYRMHDRLRYRRDGNEWVVERLAP